MITDQMRATMKALTANLSHTRSKKSCAKYLRHDGEKVVEVDRPNTISCHSMFPYKSTAMAIEPGEVPEVQERLRRDGVFVEFDREGRPEITSTKQHDALAKAMGMKTGRDGFGHTDELGRFQNSGRRRNDEIQAGRKKVRGAIERLNSMPEEVSAHAVVDVLNEYDIFPNEENTG